ncbi:hypothetical protein BWD42_07410 [Sphingobacterium sp. CZ-UAM]|uniref:FecR family protein n=1 Tax=Sphingobacterium sp. CZ-UAM TaxID=1933868 RepID=UPI000986E94B|nr:FecR family protein [Sphingobacterium sp. CZ-UAM]OOG19722.1 hypothetical protein BWD42_07410 [Sphingobacterium sp. CZ-UAM]
MKIEKDILQRYSDGQCSPEEQAFVEAWFNEYDNNTFSEAELDRRVNALDKRIMPRQNKPPFFIWTGIAAAAIVTLVLGISIFRQSNLGDAELEQFTDINAIKAPTGAHAFLVLEDQSEYNLDQLQPGDTLRAKAYQLTRDQHGELRYIAGIATATPVYHRLLTKSGGNVNLRLADGSKVWLNAYSEIKYPVQFSVRREVALQGEAYFEIASLMQGTAKVPFFVRGDQQTIQVLGTKFNASFKTDSKIALLEGKVALANAGSALESKIEPVAQLQMQPNQVYDGHTLSTVDNITAYIDWKEGYFNLQNLTLGELAPKLTDWYGVQVHVSPDLTTRQLSGEVDRKKTLVEILTLIAKVYPIHYELKNNTVLISSSKK